MNSSPKASLIICLFLFFSCAENLDFDQINDYNATPVITSSLTYFTVLPKQFFDTTGTAPITQITDESEIKIFENDFIRDKLVKADFNVEIKNEFDRDFTIEIELLNDNNFVTHRFNDLQVKANELDYKNMQTVEVSNNTNILNSTRIRITLRINNSGAPIDSADTSEFEFKSSATIYIDTDA